MLTKKQKELFEYLNSFYFRKNAFKSYAFIPFPNLKKTTNFYIIREKN